MPDQQESGDKQTGGFMARVDVQSYNGVMLPTATVLVILLMLYRQPDSQVTIALVGALSTVGFATIIQFYFGANKAGDATSTTINRIAANASSPTATAAIEPGVLGTVSQPWWGELTEAEKTSITAASAADPRINSFLLASTSGSANKDDLNYLVGKGLLTQARADAIAAS